MRCYFRQLAQYVTGYEDGNTALAIQFQNQFSYVDNTLRIESVDRLV